VTKERIVFECQNCGGQFPKWSGQCGECGKWNSLVESVVNRGRAIGSRQQGTVEEVRVTKSCMEKQGLESWIEFWEAD
jgi:DNA repair protein RadA/Sms